MQLQLDFIFKYKQLVKELEQINSRYITAKVTRAISTVNVQNNKRTDFSEEIVRNENLHKKEYRVKKQIEPMLNIINAWIDCLYLQARIICKYYVINDYTFTEISNSLNMPVKEVERIFKNSLIYLRTDKRRYDNQFYYMLDDYVSILDRDYLERYDELMELDFLIVDNEDDMKYKDKLEFFINNLEHYHYVCFVECYRNFKITIFSIARIFNKSIREVEQTIIRLKIDFLTMLLADKK